MSTSRSRWIKRITAVLVTWLLVTGLSEWLYMNPSWPGMLALILAVFSVAWLITDYNADIDAVVWTTHDGVLTRRPSVDGRMGYLRRIVTQSYEQSTPGSVKAGGAAELQEILQAVTAGRLRAQHPTAPDESAIDVIRRLAAHADTQLTTYLLSAPPPDLEAQQLNDLLTRIEDL